MKPAWPAEQTFSIPTSLMGILRMTPSYILKANMFSLFDMLPVEVLMSIQYSSVIKFQVQEKINIKP